ncbi:hypothetical protein C0585_07905 [Candidatus Woesearchaeota archaeon]|nr:MAG: hypothetical protein C0585_07905 [Candidatus Woesearchaeota archaeon]
MKIAQSRKGQVTIFIIIGIIMLLATAVIMYINKTIAESKDLEYNAGKLTDETQTVSDFVYRCFEEVGTDALMLIGQGGGYVELNRSTTIILPGMETESTGLELVEGTNMVIPYWMYMNSPNDCQTNCEFKADYVPTLSSSSDPISIENQISYYIEDNLATCLNGYQGFIEQGMTVLDQYPIAATDVQENTVVVRLDYPVNITYGNHQTELRYFEKRFDVKLYYAYWLAQMITGREKDTYFLEENLANLITSFGGIEGMIPPMYGGTDFSANSGSKSWRQSEVEDHLRGMLQANIPSIKVTNTLSLLKIQMDNGSSTWDEMINKMNYIVDLNYDALFPLDVEFMYMPNWELHVDINPRRGDVISPDSGSNPFLSFIGLGMTRYDFSYDVSYPVLVKITDPVAFNNEGWSFYFALESNLRNNQAVYAYSSDNYQNNMGMMNTEVMDICGDEFKKTGDITVKAIDYTDNYEIPDVDVRSAFVDVQCQEGITDHEGYYTGKFQSGMGYIVLSHKDYLDSYDMYLFSSNKTDYQEYVMYPKKKLEISINKLVLEKINNWVLNGSTPMVSMNGTYPHENLIIQYERKGDSISKERIMDSIMIDKNFTIVEKEFYPGKYYLNLIYLDDREFVAKAGGQNVNMSMTASINVNGSNDVYFEIMPEELYNSSSIEINILVPNFYEPNINVGTDEMELLGELSDIYMENYNLTRPIFK